MFKFALLALVVICSQAAVAAECATDLLPIPRSARRIYNIELERAGEIYLPGQKIPTLATGRHVFLITNLGEILIAPKYDWRTFQSTGRGLATHKSLLAMYLARTGRSAELMIVASGEVQMTFGEMFLLNNRSGNFPGRAFVWILPKPNLGQPGWQSLRR